MNQDLLKKWQSQLLKGTLELYILGTIAQKDRYAFEIIQALKVLDGMVSIYPLLKRLEKEQLISTYWQESQNGPPRKYYQLTAVGQDNFAQMRLEWQDFSHFLNQHLERTAHDEQPSSQGIPLTFKQTP